MLKTIKIYQAIQEPLITVLKEMLKILLSWTYPHSGSLKHVNNIAWSLTLKKECKLKVRTGCWGECLELSGRKWQEEAGKSLINEHHNCTVLHQKLLGRLKGWACGMDATEGFGKSSRTWSYHLHAPSDEMRDPEIVSPLHNMSFFMPWNLIKTSQLQLLALVLPSK